MTEVIVQGDNVDLISRTSHFPIQMEAFGFFFFKCMMYTERQKKLITSSKRHTLKSKAFK